MTMRDFIKNNKNELDIAIYRALGDWEQGTYHSASGYKLNNDDRIEWINNDEGLYRWAQMEGVRI